MHQASGSALADPSPYCCMIGKFVLPYHYLTWHFLYSATSKSFHWLPHFCSSTSSVAYYRYLKNATGLGISVLTTIILSSSLLEILTGLGAMTLVNLWLVSWCI